MRLSRSIHLAAAAAAAEAAAAARSASSSAWRCFARSLARSSASLTTRSSVGVSLTTRNSVVEVDALSRGAIGTSCISEIEFVLAPMRLLKAVIKGCAKDASVGGGGMLALALREWWSIVAMTPAAEDDGAVITATEGGGIAEEPLRGGAVLLKSDVLRVAARGAETPV